MGKIVAAIVTATLNLKAGQETCKLARQSAGVPCDIVISYDKTPRGATMNANAGFRRALETDAQYIVYIVDDVRITQQGWLKRMIEVLDSDPKLGMATPSGKCRSVQGGGRPGMRPKVILIPNMSFFCVVIKRTLMEDIGLLDESYIHYGSDNDYCMRANARGWKFAWVQDVYAHHTSTPYIAKWKTPDQALYQKRWK